MFRDHYGGKALDGPMKGVLLMHYAKRYPVSQWVHGAIVSGEYRFGNGEWVWHGPDIVFFKFAGEGKPT